jgi:hypothetical protein
MESPAQQVVGFDAEGIGKLDTYIQNWLAEHSGWWIASISYQAVVMPGERGDYGPYVYHSALVLFEGTVGP